MSLKIILAAALFICSTLPALADDALPEIPPGDPSSSMPVDQSQGQSYNVDCYIGNPSDGRNIGSLTVTAISEAGQGCNATFYDCQDKCYGCITGGDNAICVDNTGKSYRR